MKKFNKKSAVATFAIVSMLIISLYSANGVFAEEISGYPPIVQKIADKFNLNPEDVNSVFEEERAQMWERRKQNLGDRLSQAVKDGKITEDQKNMILAKKDELAAEQASERKDRRDEMRIWLTENGIDPEVLRSYIFRLSGSKMGRFGGMMTGSN